MMIYVATEEGGSGKFSIGTFVYARCLLNSKHLSYACEASRGLLSLQSLW